MKCYHHNDLDGRCAAAIINKKFDCKFIEVNYNNGIPIDKIEKDEDIIIVDFSFKPELMERVLQITKNVIWIDHHKTAMEYKYPIDLYGIRDIKFSGCELTWKYFFSDEEMPWAVRYVGDYDIWAHKYKESNYFHEAMKARDTHPTSQLWKILFNNDLESQATLNDITQDGKICCDYRDRLCEEYVKSFGFEIVFESHKCLAVGLYLFGSKTFGDKIKQYDMGITFEYNGKNWIIGLYSEKIDTSVIAKKYGGGGHTGASGFVCDKLPF
jgi:oligoribonuclease NrnB/cAMP/cGMP phosphodiesterase (DHH superfamily)